MTQGPGEYIQAYRILLNFLTDALTHVHGDAIAIRQWISIVVVIAGQVAQVEFAINLWLSIRYYT